MDGCMLRERIRKGFTRRIWIQQGARKKLQRIDVPPSETLVYLVSFAIYAFIGLIVLEVVYMIYFGAWNSEIFSAITGLIGTISGIFISQRA